MSAFHRLECAIDRDGHRPRLVDPGRAARARLAELGSIGAIINELGAQSDSARL